MVSLGGFTLCPAAWNKCEGLHVSHGKGQLKFSPLKMKLFTSKIGLHVCIEVFVESAHFHVLSDV